MSQFRSPILVFSACTIVLALMPLIYSGGTSSQTVLAGTMVETHVVSDYITFSVPEGWEANPQLTWVDSIYNVTMAAPPCIAAPDTICAQENANWPLIEVEAEAINSQATAPGDALRTALERDGVPSVDAIVAGGTGVRFLLDGSAIWREIIFVERAGFVYRFRFSDGLLALPEGRAVVDAALASVQLTPPELVSPHRQFLPVMVTGRQLTTNKASSSAMTTLTAANSAGRYNTAAAVAYVHKYTVLATNSDGCYVRATFVNDRFACNSLDKGVDGAHFVDCALKAAGFPGARCNGMNSWIGMESLRTFALASGIARVLANPDEIRAGDLLFILSNGAACWGGVVAPVEGTTAPLFIAAHSNDEYFQIPHRAELNDRMKCLSTPNTFQYVRIDGVAPTVAFTAPNAGVRGPGAVKVGYQGADDAPLSELTYTVILTPEGSDSVTLAERTSTTQLDIVLDMPCRPIALTVTAFDRADNASDPVTLSLDVGLWGDTDLNGRVDGLDLAAAEWAWGATSSDVDFLPMSDINGDGRIDATDTALVSLFREDICTN